MGTNIKIDSSRLPGKSYRSSKNAIVTPTIAQHITLMTEIYRLVHNASKLAGLARSKKIFL